MTTKPHVRMRLVQEAGGSYLRTKWPLPKARWHGRYPNVEAAVRAAREAGVPEPFMIDYVLTEE